MSSAWTSDEAWPYWEVSLTTSQEEDKGDLLVWGWGSWQEAHDFALSMFGRTAEQALLYVQHETDLCDAGYDFHEDCVIDGATVRKMLSVPSPDGHPILAQFKVRLKKEAA